MSTATTKKAYAGLVLTCIIWGTTWIASRLGIEGVHPLFYSAIRQTIAGSCFLLYFVVQRKAVWPNLRQWGYLLMMGTILFVISNAFTIWSVKYMGSGLGAVLGAIFPIWVAIIDWLLGTKNRPNWISTLGLILGLAGVVIIFSEHLSDFSNEGFVTGVILSVIATLTWAIGSVIMSRKVVTLDRHYSLGWQMFLAGILLNIITHAGGFAIPLQQVPMHTWVSIAYMVLFGSIIAFGALLYTIEHLPTTLASVYAYINPIVAVLLGHFILNEPWSPLLLLGAVVTIGGIYLVNMGFRKYIKELDEKVE